MTNPQTSPRRRRSAIETLPAFIRDPLQLLNGDLSAGTGSDAASAPGDVTAPVTAPPQKRRHSVALERRDPMTTTSPQSNTPKWEDLLAIARDLGTQAGQGKDTQIKFDLKVLEAAYLGGLDLLPNKHGPDRRDGTLLAEEYTKAQTGATMFDAKAPAGRKLVSNIDKMIKLGTNPKWGTGEPLSTVNALVSHRQTLRRDPAKAKGLDDAHNMLMRFATAQLKRDTLIDGEELKSYAYKKERDPRTAEEVLVAIRKLSMSLTAGKVSNCPDMDDSPEVKAITAAATKRLAAIAKARGQAQGPNPSTP